MNNIKDIQEQSDIITLSVKRLENASVRSIAGRIDFDNTARMDVFSSSDVWVLYEGIDSVITRVISRDSLTQRAVKIECHWIRSGFLPPHYHSEEEKVTVVQGSMTLFVKVENDIIEIPLDSGMTFSLDSDQHHAGYVHAGTKYILEFHPPIKVSS